MFAERPFTRLPSSVPSAAVLTQQIVEEYTARALPTLPDPPKANFESLSEYLFGGGNQSLFVRDLVQWRPFRRNPNAGASCCRGFLNLIRSSVRRYDEFRRTCGTCRNGFRRGLFSVGIRFHERANIIRPQYLSQDSWLCSGDTDQRVVPQPIEWRTPGQYRESNCSISNYVSGRVVGSKST